MSKKVCNDVIAALNHAGASMRCKQATALLKELGFEVRDGNRGGHKIYTHQYIQSFTSGSYNCDHGKNPEIKRPYIKKIIKVLEKYEQELVKYLENKNES